MFVIIFTFPIAAIAAFVSGDLTFSNIKFIMLIIYGYELIFAEIIKYALGSNTLFNETMRGQVKRVYQSQRGEGHALETWLGESYLGMKEIRKCTLLSKAIDAKKRNNGEKVLSIYAFRTSKC